MSSDSAAGDLFQHNIEALLARFRRLKAIQDELGLDLQLSPSQQLENRLDRVGRELYEIALTIFDSNDDSAVALQAKAEALFEYVRDEDGVVEIGARSVCAIVLKGDAKRTV